MRKGRGDRSMQGSLGHSTRLGFDTEQWEPKERQDGFTLKCNQSGCFTENTLWFRTVNRLFKF